MEMNVDQQEKDALDRLAELLNLNSEYAYYRADRQDSAGSGILVGEIIWNPIRNNHDALCLMIRYGVAKNIGEGLEGQPVFLSMEDHEERMNFVRWYIVGTVTGLLTRLREMENNGATLH